MIKCDVLWLCVFADCTVFYTIYTVDGLRYLGMLLHVINACFFIIYKPLYLHHRRSPTQRQRRRTGMSTLLFIFHHI